MKNIITKDIEYMKYVLGYKRGVVISEQPIKKTSLSEQQSTEGCIKGNCKDGQGTFNYKESDGSYSFVDVGEFKDGDLFNGKRTFKYFNGVSGYYEIKDGVKGEIIQQTKENKEGCIDGNCKDGKGTYQKSNLNQLTIWSGEFKNGDLFNGQITVKTSTGYNNYIEDKDGVKSGFKDGEPNEKPNNTQSNSNCVQPTQPTHSFKNDKNYRYAKSGDCWWAKNINNKKWINLTKLVKTKPKFQSSIDKLNDGTDLIKL